MTTCRWSGPEFDKKKCSQFKSRYLISLALDSTLIELSKETQTIKIGNFSCRRFCIIFNKKSSKRKRTFNHQISNLTLKLE